MNELSKNPIVKPTIIRIRVKGDTMQWKIKATNESAFKGLDMEIKLESKEDIIEFFDNIKARLLG